MEHDKYCICGKYDHFVDGLKDPLNEMSVKEYNDNLIEEKKDQLNGARNILYKTMEDIKQLEAELISLILEQQYGYSFHKKENRNG